MLDLGFLPDVEKIVRLIPAGRQTMLFSATMPGAIITLARSYMHHPTHIRAVDPDDDGQTVKAVEQHVFRAHAMDKVEMLARILQAEGRGLTLVFCRTKRTAAKVADDLADRGFASGAVHGDLGQGAREQALRAFRSGKVDVLVATDVAARGIDVQDITHVVNYQCPEDEKTYLHRIGRTARAGATGIAITFVDWDDMPRWSADRQGARPRLRRARGDLLELGPPLRGARHPAARHRRAAARAAHPGRPGRRGGRGPRRDRPGRWRPWPRRRTGRGAQWPRRAVAAGGDRPTGPSGRSGRAAAPRRSRTRTRGGQPAEGAATTAGTATRDRRRRRHPRRRRRSRGGARRAAAPPTPDRRRARADQHERDLEVLRRWETSGAAWRVLDRGPARLDDRAADLRRGRAGGPAGLRRAGPARARRRARPAATRARASGRP